MKLRFGLCYFMTGALIALPCRPALAGPSDPIVQFGPRASAPNFSSGSIVPTTSYTPRPASTPSGSSSSARGGKPRGENLAAAVEAGLGDNVDDIITAVNGGSGTGGSSASSGGSGSSSSSGSIPPMAAGMLGGLMGAALGGAMGGGGGGSGGGGGGGESGGCENGKCFPKNNGESAISKKTEKREEDKTGKPPAEDSDEQPFGEPPPGQYPHEFEPDLSEVPIENETVSPPSTYP